MRLTLGSRSYDLTVRAIVLGVGAPEDLATQGADIVESPGAGVTFVVTAPFIVTVAGDVSLDDALTSGPGVVRLLSPTADALRRCAEAGVAVLVPAGAVGDAGAAGLPPERVVPDTLLLDVTGSECPTAATAVGVIRGARIVRTADVRGARRICDVLAAVMEAR